MSLEKLSLKVLETLEDIFGQQVASLIMSFIVASRSGLNESEIVELTKANCKETTGEGTLSKLSLIYLFIFRVEKYALHMGEIFLAE